MKTITTLFFFIFTSHVYATEVDSLQKLYDQFTKVEGQQTLVNYRGIKESPKLLDIYLNSVAKVKKEDYTKWSDRRKLAFLINTYNAYTIKLIINHYPLKSIRDIGNFFKGPWKQKDFLLFGKKVHLDHIEHELIRKNFNEPRIHFAVVCASIGCPSLSTIAFTENNLEELLEKAAQNFLSNKDKNELKNNTLYLSKIFKWYGDDFDKNYQSYRHYVSKYLTSNKELQGLINNGKIDIEWNSYDWNLNEYK